MPVGRVAAGALAEEEPLIRLGGEEFLLLLVGDEPKRVAERVERLRRKIADCRFGREELPLWMTASLGFCDYPCIGSWRIRSGI